MIETLVFLGIYFSIAFVSSFFFTSKAYKMLLDANPQTVKREDIGNERWLELEAIRRKNYAAISKRYGFLFATFWCIVIPIELLLQILSWASISLNWIAISKHDQDFLTEQSNLKAQKILDEYNKQQREQFDKALKD